MSCGQTAVGRGALQHVLPITYWYEGALATLMREYKSPGSARYAEMKLIMLEFLRRHRRCATEGAAVSLVTSVPSTQGRPGEHPMLTILKSIYKGDSARGVLQPHPEHVKSLSRNRPVREAFVVTENLAGTHVLLVDDTMTSGARLQSAAMALHDAGGHVEGAVVAGRKINPDFANTAALIELSGETRFSWDVCAATTGCRYIPDPPF